MRDDAIILTRAEADAVLEVIQRYHPLEFDHWERQAVDRAAHKIKEGRDKASSRYVADAEATVFSYPDGTRLLVDLEVSPKVTFEISKDTAIQVSFAEDPDTGKPAGVTIIDRSRAIGRTYIAPESSNMFRVWASQRSEQEE